MIEIVREFKLFKILVALTDSVEHLFVVGKTA